MYTDTWSKPPLVPFGEEWSGPQGGVAACMNWSSSPSYKSLLRPNYQQQLQQQYATKSCLKNPTMSFRDRLVETEYTVPDSSTLPARYVPTPPAHGRSYNHTGVDTYRDRTTPYGDTTVTTYRSYTPAFNEDIGTGLRESMQLQPHPPGESFAPRPPLHQHSTTPRSHRACHVSTKDVFMLDKAREEYEASLGDGFLRDKALEHRLYGFNPRDIERSRPGSAVNRSYRLGTPGTGRRPHTTVNILDENYQDTHVTWHPDVPESTRSRGYPGTRSGHFDQWRHHTDSYVDQNGRVVKPRHNNNQYHHNSLNNQLQRDNYGYWKMARFTKNAKSKVSSRWEPPRSEDPPKVNLQMDCPDDSDMLVSFRVRSAKM